MKQKISLAAITAILVATGYGGYTLIKEKDLEVPKLFPKNYGLFVYPKEC